MQDLCLLCKSPTGFIYNSKGFDIYKCENCNFAQIAHQPNSLQIKKIYSELHFKHQLYREASAARIENFFRFDMVSRYISNGKLLDAGCGSGDFLEIAKEKFNVSGLDVSSEAIKHAKVRLPELKKHLHSGMIEDFTKSSFQFDAVCLWDVIEHLNNPQLAIQQLFGMVKKNGILFISTPDFGSLIAKIMKNNWAFMIPPLHTCYFSKRAFQIISEKIGAKIHFILTKGKTTNISFLFYKINQMNENIISKRFLDLLTNSLIGKLKIYIPTNDILYLGLRK